MMQIYIYNLITQDFLMAVSDSDKRLKVWEIQTGSGSTPISVNVNDLTSFPIYGIHMMSSQQQPALTSKLFLYK